MKYIWWLVCIFNGDFTQRLLKTYWPIRCHIGLFRRTCKPQTFTIPRKPNTETTIDISDPMSVWFQNNDTRFAISEETYMIHDIRTIYQGLNWNGADIYYLTGCLVERIP